MIRRRKSLFTAAGSVALAVGICVHFWTHGNFAHFTSGFLMGVSIALLILGLGRQAQSVSR